jgi:hypothetical protein
MCSRFHVGAERFPEIVARGSHQKKNDQRKETQRLKGEISDATVSRIADEKTDERILIPMRVKLEQRKPSVCQAQQKRRDPQVSAVVKQRKKTAIQPAQGSDAKHHVQQQECSCSKRANQQGHCRRAWVTPSAYTEENSEVQCQQRQKCEVVHFLLPVPTDCGILNAHGNFSTLAVSNRI